MNHVVCYSLVVFFVTFCGSLVTGRQVRYRPNWQSLESRPLPRWFDDAKFGIFIHWGVYSVPGFGSEWFWYELSLSKDNYVKFMKDNYPPNFSYAEFAPHFKAEFYDPNQWVDLFVESGARYVVLTSKHHEGYTLWPSKYSYNWNSVDVGPKRDLVGDLAKAIKTRTNLKFGLYHSLLEWFHPLYMADRDTNFNSKTFPGAKTMVELYELVKQYEPSIIWSDGQWEASDEYWNSTDFLAWLYNDSPVKDFVVTNDRWGNNTQCKHGGFFNCADKYNPGVLQERKWENCMTIDRNSWGYRRNAKLTDFLSINELLQTLAETVSCGGNLLMNVGPTHDGVITPIFETRLRQMGQWLKVNGEAIYGTKPWNYQNDTVTKGVWYTSKPGIIYAIVLDWPSSNMVHLGAVSSKKNWRITMLGYNKPLPWTSIGMGIVVSFPELTPNLLPCEWAWVLKIVTK